MNSLMLYLSPLLDGTHSRFCYKSSISILLQAYCYFKHYLFVCFTLL